MTEKQFDELLAKSWDTAQEAKIRANERQKVLAEIEEWANERLKDDNFEEIDILNELRAKLEEMKGGK